MRRTACAALVADGSDAGLGGELVFGREALADDAEFGEDLSDADPAPALGEGHDAPAVAQVGDEVLHAARDPGDLGDEGLRGRASVRTSSPLASASASLAHTSGARRRRSRKAPGDRSASVAMLGEEAGQAFGPGAFGGFQAWD